MAFECAANRLWILRILNVLAAAYAHQGNQVEEFIIRKRTHRLDESNFLLAIRLKNQSFQLPRS